MDLLIPSSPGGLPTLSLTISALGEGCHASHQPCDASTTTTTTIFDFCFKRPIFQVT